MSNEPYYLWNIRAETDGAYHTVRVDSVDDLLNQTEVRKCCLRDLNWMPFRLSDDDWTKTVNEALTGVEGRLVSVAREIDATETGALWGLFVRYLTRKQTQNCRPDMVRLGQVYVTEGTYYFSVDGFIAFLRAEKFPRGKINLRDALISYGCTEGDLEYRPKRCNSEVKKIRCWKKTEDAELAEMSVFYGDVCEDDIEVLQKDTEAKKDTEGVNDKDVKF
jgi:hypothetical protein